MGVTVGVSSPLACTGAGSATWAPRCGQWGAVPQTSASRHGTARGQPVEEASPHPGAPGTQRPQPRRVWAACSMGARARVCTWQWREGLSTPKSPGTCSQPASGPCSLGQGLRSSTPCFPCPGWVPPLPVALGLISCAQFLPRDSVMGQLEHPMGMVETTSRSGQKRPSFLEGGLLLLLLLLTGALVALGLLYAHSRGEQGHPPSPSPTTAL